ncbi:hypothetical protein [Bradyrhizobium sp. BR13661]|jgi:hypothetical protein|uniref:hypothetical protein n=1 Tax=Bradyrhizobium sp. BR13661 TaxID=2940622 RepID=UPI00247575B5|nr:hypothetical protein [Bradyrhizobium sp. BR13661]MDH6258875.1 hypothetical protein [Bradyrhizobium sp. BR13661]
MTRRNVVESILTVLDPYLERVAKDWAAQPDHDRYPTLPLTPAGNVNASAIVRALGLDQHDVQHFHRKEELRNPVNVIASVQGVPGIKSHFQQDEAYAGARIMIGRNAKEISDLRRNLSEREAVISSLRAENARLKARLDLFERTGVLFRVGRSE